VDTVPAAYKGAATLREALRAFLHQSDAITRRHGLTTQRYELLLMVKTSPDGSGRSTLSQLAERMSLAQSSTTELVNRTEGLGLVRREPDPTNRRVVFVRLTEEGERRLAAALTDLTGERKRLVSLVSRLR
jgi:DNA-binding MarR family transcriptional regulator